MLVVNTLIVELHVLKTSLTLRKVNIRIDQNHFKTFENYYKNKIENFYCGLIDTCPRSYSSFLNYILVSFEFNCPPDN